VSAGEISVTGLKSELTVIPETQYYYYNPHFEPEPENGDIFDEGTAIDASAPGNEVPGFEVSGLGVADMETELQCDFMVDGQSDLVVKWTPGTQDDKVVFAMRSGNHGAQFSSITCETEDTGELVVSAELLLEYVLEFRPFDVWFLSRTSSSSTETETHEIRLTTTTSTGCAFQIGEQ